MQLIWIHGKSTAILNVPHEVISEADCTVDDHTVTYFPCRKKRNEFNSLLQGFTIGLSRFQRLLRALSVPMVMVTWHLVYSEVEEYAITIGMKVKPTMGLNHLAFYQLKYQNIYFSTKELSAL